MDYSEVAQNAKKLKKQIAEQSGVETNYINDRNLVEAQRMLKGAKVVTEAGGDPTAVDPATLKAQAAGPAPVQEEGRAPAAAEPSRKKETAADLSKQQKIAMAIVQIAPTLLGYAVGGDEGGAVGANVTLNAMKQMGEQQQADAVLAQRREMQEAQLAARKEEKDADRQARLEAEAQRAQDKRELAGMIAGNKGPVLTKGQEALDKKVAADYNEWVAQGGATEMQKNLKNLKASSATLGKSNTASGPIVGMFSKGIRDTFTPEGAAVQDEIENVVQRNMRVIFGSQFTENEGKQLLARAYNPRQSEKENKRRVDALIEQMERAGQAKAESMAYFEENGTLKGFKPSMNLDPNALMNSLEQVADSGQEGGAGNPAIPKAEATPMRTKPLEKMNPQELEAHNKKLRSMLKPQGG